MDDARAIRDLIENWVIWRDTGEWARLRAAWHADGRMAATWFQGSADDFVAACARAFQGPSMGHHVLGGASIEVRGARALAQTRVTLALRTTLDGVLCDATCIGRFFDFLEKRDGRWGLVLRQPIYEKDRIDAVDPGAALVLDQALLATFPAGYRHLAYLQAKSGLPIKRDMPGLTGEAVETLKADGRDWLAGAPLAR